jgi:Ca-activated chloride channel family protein
MQTLKPGALSAITGATGGIYTIITENDSDIAALATLNQSTNLISDNAEQSRFDIRRDGGWLLALLLLPIALYMFRRNLLWSLVLIVPFTEPASATDFDSWWRNTDQQAMQALKRGDTRRAAALFEDPRWSVVANYRAGQFAAAAKTAIPNPGPDDLYNRANAIAMTGELVQAIKIYDQVLQQVPDHADARFNRTLAEQTWERIQQERLAQQDREKRLVGEEAEASDQGDEQAPPGPSSQANQVGGTSSDVQSNEQGALNDQGSSDQRSDAREEQQTLPGDPTAERERADRNPARKEASQSATLNPYAEQWLRNLKNDPGALMRRKFQFQANQRARIGSVKQIERRY